MPLQEVRQLKEAAIEVVCDYEDVVFTDEDDFWSLPLNMMIKVLQKMSEKKLLDALFQHLTYPVLKIMMKNDHYLLPLIKLLQELADNGYPWRKLFVQDFYKRLNTRGNSKEYILQAAREAVDFASFLTEYGWFESCKRLIEAVEYTLHQWADDMLQDPDFGRIYMMCTVILFRSRTSVNDLYGVNVVVEEKLPLFRKLQVITYFDMLPVYVEVAHAYCCRNECDIALEWISRGMVRLMQEGPPPDPMCVAQLLGVAAKVYGLRRNFVKARFLMTEALIHAENAVGLHHPRASRLLMDFALCMLNTDHVKHSVLIYQFVYETRRQLFGEESNNLLLALVEEDLAYATYVSEYGNGSFDASLFLANCAVDKIRSASEAPHPLLASAIRVMALITEEVALDNFNHHLDHERLIERLKKSEELHKAALQTALFVFGQCNVLTARHFGNLGRLYQSMGRYKKSERMHLKAIAIKEKILGENDYEVGLSIGHLASLYNYHMHKYDKAEELYLRSLKINRALFSDTYSGLEYDYRGLVHVYQQTNQPSLYAEYRDLLTNFLNNRTEEVVLDQDIDYYKRQTSHDLFDVLQVFNTPTEDLSKLPFLSESWLERHAPMPLFFSEKVVEPVIDLLENAPSADEPLMEAVEENIPLEPGPEDPFILLPDAEDDLVRLAAGQEVFHQMLNDIDELIDVQDDDDDVSDSDNEVLDSGSDTSEEDIADDLVHFYDESDN